MHSNRSIEREVLPSCVEHNNSDTPQRSNILLLVAHEPERDPRCAWVASSGGQDYVVHQLGVSRVPKCAQTETGSQKSGFVWTIPRCGCIDDLGVIKQLIFSQRQSRGLLELAALISIRSLNDSSLKSVLGCGDSPRFNHFRSNVSYILEITYTLVRFANNLVGLDAIIATDLDTLLAGVVLKEIFNVPLIYDAHEFWPEADVSQDDFEKKFWISLENRLVSQVDYAQTVTPGLAAHMSRLYSIPFSYTPNAEPKSSFLSSDKSWASSGQVGASCRFLFQGGFAPARGIDLLINIWPLTDSDAILVLRGPDNEYRHDMIRLAKALGLYDKRVFFVEAVNESELVGAAFQFDVGVIPYTPTGLNYSNCCPNKLSQYMAAHLPILASKTAFVEQVVRDSGAGSVVDLTDVDEVVREVNRFVRDIEYRRRCSEKSAEFFIEKFNWEVLSSEFFSRIRLLLDKSALRQKAKFGFVNNPPFFEAPSSFEVATSNRPAQESRPRFSFFRRVWHFLPAAFRYRFGPLMRKIFKL